MPSTQTKDFLSGQLHHVDIHSIERELYRLWEEAEEKPDSQDTPHVTRACALNFIALSNNEEQLQKIEDIVSEIAIKHPSRAIIASAKDAQEESLEAWVTARCHQIPGKKRQQICCEQIIVEWKGQGTRELVSVVAPLTIPDLPTCLWWHEDSLCLDRIRPFLNHVDRFLVDSRYLSKTTNANNNPILQLQSLNDCIVKGSAIYDLNWARTLPWRKSIANSFDSKRGLLNLEDLDIISTVEIIEEAGTKESDSTNIAAQSWLMLGWLASRLNWKFERVEVNSKETLVYFRLNRTLIKVRLKPFFDSTSNCHLGRIREIRIKLRNEDKSILRVWPDLASPGLRTDKICQGNIDEKDIDHNPRSTVELIDLILDDPVRPITFEESLNHAATVLRQIR